MALVYLITHSVLCSQLIYAKLFISRCSFATFMWKSFIGWCCSIFRWSQFGDIKPRFVMGQLGTKGPETSIFSRSVQVPQSAETWWNKISYRYLRKLTHPLWLSCLAFNIQKCQCLRPRRNKRLHWKHVRVHILFLVVKTAVICFNLWVYVCSISFKYTHSKGNQSLCC